MTSALTDDLDLSGNYTTIRHDDTCAAFRLHRTLLHRNFRTDAPLGEVAALQTMPYAATIVALMIAFFGGRLLRPSVCVLAFCVTAISTLHITYEYASTLHNWNCDAVVVASVVTGGIAAMASATVVRAVAVVLGVVSGGAIVILLFDICRSCNEEQWPGAPVLLGRSLVPFWLTFVVGAAVGGAICRKKEQRVLCFVTAVIGGWGATVGVGLCVAARGATMPAWAEGVVAFLSTSGGFAFQMWRARQAAAPVELAAPKPLTIALTTSAPPPAPPSAPPRAPPSAV